MLLDNGRVWVQIVKWGVNQERFSFNRLILVHFDILKNIFSVVFLLLMLMLISSVSQAIVIDWYDPVFDGTDTQGRAKLTISGETEPLAKVIIDLSKVIVIRGPQRGKKLSPESVTAIADDRGVFELKTKFPKGLLQVPILVKGEEAQTILILFDISDSTAKLNVKTKRRPEKIIPPPKPISPPTRQVPVQAKIEEREKDKDKEFNFRLGIGGNYQKTMQKQEGANELSFQNIQFPSLTAAFGVEGRHLSGEIGYQTHPSSVTEAETPFTLVNGKINWNIVTADLFWRLRDRTNSKMGTKFRLGVQSHNIPFLSINTSNQVNLLQNNMFGLTIGYGSKFGDPQGWTYDAMFSYIYPISYDSSELKSFSLLPKLGLELNFGVSRRVSDLWFWGGRWCAQIQSHGFSYKNTAGTTNFNGEFSAFLSIFNIDVGYNF
ncbi:MAG: hypothetical protein A4S09_13355 [Proteobacteria bacterium SG_bin7]|nr:MAG: hypothetical protein A4S09_13355 [Proteobacteria bacterium SG_bin7]